MAHEQRHPQREGVLAGRYADHVGRRLAQGGAHRDVVGVAQPVDLGAARGERLRDLLGQVAGPHQQHAHARGPYTVSERSPQVTERLKVASRAKCEHTSVKVRVT